MIFLALAEFWPFRDGKENGICENAIPAALAQKAALILRKSRLFILLIVL
jgi:hypothetical protein